MMGGVDKAEIQPRLALCMRVDGNGLLLSSHEVSLVNESTWNEQRPMLMLECTLVLQTPAQTPNPMHYA